MDNNNVIITIVEGWGIFFNNAHISMTEYYFLVVGRLIDTELCPYVVYD